MEKVLILNASRNNFTNDKTGEVITYSNTTIAHWVEESENFLGYVLEEITGKIEDYQILRKYVGKVVNVELIYKKVDKKNYRAKISKIEEITL